MVTTTCYDLDIVWMEMQQILQLKSQDVCEWFGHDLQVLFVKLEQILHLEVDCSDFALIRPCSEQGQFTLTE